MKCYSNEFVWKENGSSWFTLIMNFYPQQLQKVNNVNIKKNIASQKVKPVEKSGIMLNFIEQEK